jgi:threonine dehydrogenase-like Zn-dependent dehydrogenase
MGRRSTHIVIGPSFVIAHRMGLDDAPQNYETCKQKEDDGMKAVLTP